MTKEELLKQLGFNEYKKQQFSCEACQIEHSDKHVKQMPRHTCGIDGPNPDITELKADIKKQQPTDPNAAYNAEVLRIATLLAKLRYERVHIKSSQEQRLSWEQHGPHYRDVQIKDKMAEARAMVAEMEKEAKHAYCQAINDLGYTANWDCPDLKEHLVKRGLIPAIPNTKTDDNA